MLNELFYEHERRLILFPVMSYKFFGKMQRLSFYIKTVVNFQCNYSSVW